MKPLYQKLFTVLLGVGLSFGLLPSVAADQSLKEVMQARGLTEKDILAAAKTYTPTGGRDEYLAFSSGGQSGHVIVYGVPSMRILKYIAVFTPEPWQGYGFDDESKAVLAMRGVALSWMNNQRPLYSPPVSEIAGWWVSP